MQSIILDCVNVCIVVAICYPVIECVCIGTDMNNTMHIVVAICYPVIECVCIGTDMNNTVHIVVAMCYPVMNVFALVLT